MLRLNGEPGRLEHKAKRGVTGDSSSGPKDRVLTCSSVVPSAYSLPSPTQHNGEVNGVSWV